MIEEGGIGIRASKMCDCEACKKRRGDVTFIYPKDINGWRDAPSGGWCKTLSTEERRAGESPLMFLGVELETHITSVDDAVSRELIRRFPDASPRVSHLASQEQYREWRIRQVAVEDERAFHEKETRSKLRNDPKIPCVTAAESVSIMDEDLWYAKHDGSVSGPEFASHPLTLKAWYERHDQLEKEFSTLLHAGIRSHTGDTAGMHVSVSLSSLDGSEHIIRLAKILRDNENWALRVSQRTKRSSHWGDLNPYHWSSDRTLSEWARNVARYGKDESVNRYAAWNAPGHDRLEFRLPRGTLRLDRFYKNLEWTVALVEYTRQFDDLKSTSFMRWVMGQKAYPYLRAFLHEKFGIGDGPSWEPTRAPMGDDNIPITTEPERDDDDLCPCGDGCRYDDCPACDDEPDDEPHDLLCGCGIYHDLRSSAYRRYQGEDTTLTRHSDTEGDTIYMHDRYEAARVYNGVLTEDRNCGDAATAVACMTLTLACLFISRSCRLYS